MRLFNRKFLIVILLSILGFEQQSSIVFAQEKALYESIDLGKLMRERIDKHSRILNFELGKTKLTEVEETLGQTTVAIAGTGHDRFKQICYIADSSSDPIMLIFANDFIHGKKIHEVTLKEILPNEINKSKCTTSNKINKNVKTESGLGLNLNESELYPIAGYPNAGLEAPIGKRKYEYRTQYNIGMNPEEITELGAEEFPYWTVKFILTVKIENGKITSLTIFRRTSS